MKNLIVILSVMLSLSVLFPCWALAYVGPGAGLTLIGSLIGALVAVVLAIGAVLFWPLRKMLKKMKEKKGKGEN